MNPVCEENTTWSVECQSVQVGWKDFDLQLASVDDIDILFELYIQGFSINCYLQKFYDVVRTVNFNMRAGVLLIDDIGTAWHADVIEVFQIFFFGDVVFAAFYNRTIHTGSGGEYQEYPE